MKKHLIVLFFVMFITKINYGQKWTYHSGGNVFDGKYRTCSVIGTGGEFPYKTPIFVINLFNDESLNLYISEAGYAGCDNKIAYIKFDNKQELYTSRISTNSDRDVWFLTEVYDDKRTIISIAEFINKLKNHNTIHIRLSSDCGKNDYKFSLSGSSVALNYVVSDYFKKIEENKIIEEKEKEKERRKREELISLISSEGSFKSKAKYNLSILYKPEPTASYKNIIIKEGIEIVFSNYSPSEKFCIIKSASNIELPTDSTFYINKLGIDLEFIERIDVE